MQLEFRGDPLGDILEFWGYIVLVFGMLAALGITMSSSLSKRRANIDHKKDRFLSEKRLLKQLFKNAFQGHARRIQVVFEGIRNFIPRIQNMAMVRLLKKSEKDDLEHWYHFFPIYRDLEKPWFFYFLEKHFLVQDEGELRPYSNNPQVQDWYEKNGLEVPKYQGADLSLVDKSTGEVSLGKPKGNQT